MVGGAEVLDQLRLGPVGDLIEDVDLEAALHPEHRAEQADRPGSGDQHPTGLEAHRLTDPLDLLDRLGNDRGRLHQHPDRAQPRVELDAVLALHPPALRAVAVELVDPPLLEEAVPAHVEFAPLAGFAGDRVGTADDPDDQVASREAAVRGRLLDDPERLVPEHQPFPSGGRLAVVAGDDLAVGSADADREAVDQYVSLFGAWLLDVGHRGRAGPLRDDGKCSHALGAASRGGCEAML